MKTTKARMAGMVGILALATILLAYPVMAVQQQATASTQAATSSPPPTSADKQRLDLKVGQTITITSIAGKYRPVATPTASNSTATGTATASMTLTVTGAFKNGYALSVTGGSVALGSTTYTITSGSAELGPYGHHMVGQGAGANGVQFLFHERGIGDFGGNQYGILRVDLSNGSAEYLAEFLVTIAAS